MSYLETLVKYAFGILLVVTMFFFMGMISCYQDVNRRQSDTNHTLATTMAQVDRLELQLIDLQRRCKINDIGN